MELIFAEVYSVCAVNCTGRPYGLNSGALAYFRGPLKGTGGWAMSDLTLYFTAFHNDIVYVSNNTAGFEMQRVSVRTFSMSPHWLPFLGMTHA